MREVGGGMHQLVKSGDHPPSFLPLESNLKWWYTACMTIEMIINDLANVAKYRRELLGGREYFVAPTVMMVEGVHNGSIGPLYYPKDEIEFAGPSWNSIPVVVYHPVENGKHVSAKTPGVLDRQGVGFVLSSNVTEGRNTSETWIDAERIQQVHPVTYQRILRNESIEVSTGLGARVIKEDGDWKGTKYVGVARVHVPDHLAILPDGEGACSIKAGCGLLRNSLSENEFIANAKFKGMSYGETMEAVQKAFRDKFVPNSNSGMLIESPYIIEIFDDSVVYRNKEALFRLAWDMKDGNVSFSDIPEEVTKITTYKAKSDFVGNEEKKTMCRKDQVTSLITNAESDWSEEDRTFLEGISEPQFNKIVANMFHPKKKKVPAEDEEDEEEMPMMKKKKEGIKQIFYVFNAISLPHNRGFCASCAFH